MVDEQKSKLRLEIAHVLFIDIVGYSKLRTNEQSAQIEKLREIVRGTEQFRTAEAEGKLIRLPTGDGGALAFRNNPEAPVLCAEEIAKTLKGHPEIRVRMGIHSGPVNEVTDLNEQANIAGAGINIAQRVMDCGDAGHILLSRHVAEDLEHYPRWQPYLHSLGDFEAKHGQVISVVNFYNHEIGNPAIPETFRKNAPAGKTTPANRRHYLIAAMAIGALILLAAIALLFRSGRNETGSATSLASIPEKSIAVLPFENLSDDKSNAYFTDGIQDEILTRLSKIAALKVISRTSTTKYKSVPDSLRDVGKQLGVANVLEGSVQKIANAVHVNVQLIHAATDEHLWAESYNRKLDDVFGVEGEVANAIADQLNMKLSGAEQKAVAEKPTQNAAAYDAYLRGLNIEHNNYNYEAYVQAEHNYRCAVELDPNFALAWARLAILRSFLNFNAIDLKTYTADSVKQAADRAMALAPDAGESWIAQGSYRYRILRDFNSALAAYEEARKRMPNSALVYEYLGFILRRLGRWQDAETNYKKAIELDPRDVQLLTAVGNEFYMYLRRFDDALASADRALQIAPDAAVVHANKAVVLQTAGRVNEARQELALVPDEVLDDWVVAARITQAMYERRFGDVINVVERKLNSLLPNQPLDSFANAFLVQMGQCQEWLGQHEAARQAFERAVREIKPTPDSVVRPDANGTPSILAQAYAGLDEKENALQQAAQAVKDYDGDAINQPQAEVQLAQIQARFGDIDSTIAALPHLLEVPAGLTVANLKFDPLWDPLRKDPRFEKLCQGSNK
ncbi:MAG TPA: tetratricopeptide repeat protein [Candidatus Udaeobacter sp.]|jgi:TolB-like protein/predicted Zn-dependent protease|nr:tetratricopeptide repeat protein [Candidatus Udaeobacter sp.]